MCHGAGHRAGGHGLASLRGIFYTEMILEVSGFTEKEVGMMVRDPVRPRIPHIKQSQIFLNVFILGPSMTFVFLPDLGLFQSPYCSNFLE